MFCFCSILDLLKTSIILKKNPIRDELLLRIKLIGILDPADYDSKLS